MIVEYCDLCGAPLKDNSPKAKEIYYLYMTAGDSDVDFADKEALAAYLNSVSKEIKSVCPRCKEIFDLIFHYRYENLAKIKQELLANYRLPSKEPKNEKISKKTNSKKRKED